MALNGLDICRLGCFLNVYYDAFLHGIAAATDYGHPERVLIRKSQSFGLGQTNWAENLGGILAISSQTIGTILAL